VSAEVYLCFILTVMVVIGIVALIVSYKMELLKLKKDQPEPQEFELIEEDTFDVLRDAFSAMAERARGRRP
jgi:hypothetical protein